MLPQSTGRTGLSRPEWQGGRLSQHSGISSRQGAASHLSRPRCVDNAGSSPAASSRHAHASSQLGIRALGRQLDWAASVRATRRSKQRSCGTAARDWSLSRGVSVRETRAKREHCGAWVGREAWRQARRRVTFEHVSASPRALRERIRHGRAASEPIAPCASLSAALTPVTPVTSNSDKCL